MTPAALVTGGAKRIGKEIALHLATQGYDIALHYHHSETEAQQTKQSIETLGRQCQLIQADLTVEDDINSSIKKAYEHFPAIECLINNASIYQEDRFSDFTKHSWDKHMNSNCFAPLLLSQQFAAHLPSHAQGNIINISDSATIRPRREKVFSYQLSKSLLNQATELLATQLPSHIRINTIALGNVLKNPRENRDIFEQHQRNCPLKQGAGVNDIIKAMDYILHASSVTGSTLPVDGGKWTT